MAEIRIVRDYPHPPAMVWRAVTDPELVARWTATGRGGRPVGFIPTVGNRFQFVGKPVPGWRGVVDCEVLEVDEPRRLRYTWQGEENGKRTVVAYRIEPRPDGTRFTFEHTGFTGLGGFLMLSCSARSGRRCSTSVSPPYWPTWPTVAVSRRFLLTDWTCCQSRTINAS